MVRRSFPACARPLPPESLHGVDTHCPVVPVCLPGNRRGADRCAAALHYTGSNGTGTAKSSRQEGTVRVEETTELVLERVARRSGRELTREHARSRRRLVESKRLGGRRTRRRHRSLGAYQRRRRRRSRDLRSRPAPILEPPAARRAQQTGVTSAELARARVSFERCIEPHRARRRVEGECRDCDCATSGASTLSGRITTRATLDHDIEGTCPAAIAGGNLTAVSLNARC